MLVAGARCDQCGRLDTMEYRDETLVVVLLREKGWTFKDNDKKAICPLCTMKNRQHSDPIYLT